MAEASYKIKRILWPPWAEGERSVGHVGILCQDINGPCPLLAILNVLLLRGNINLPSDAGEITEDRAVQILAEYLLDINASRQSQSDATDEYRANLEANVSDAIATLPKLTTGVDVNVRFNGVRNVEFTQETAVFDILDVPLVHGWLVDPQDPAAAVLGTRSYNDVVMRIIATLGESGTPKVASRRSMEPFRSSSMRGSSSRSRQGVVHETGTTNIACEASGNRQRIITGEMLNEALKASMSAAGAIDPRNETLESGSGTMMKTPEIAKNASSKDDGMDSAINTMLSQVVKEAFKTPEGRIASKGTEKIKRGAEGGGNGEEERGSMKMDQPESCGLDDSSSRKIIDDASTRRTILNDGLDPIDDSCCGQISKSPGEGTTKLEQQDNLIGPSTSGETTDQEPRGLSSGKVVSRGDEHSGGSRLLRDAMSTGISPNKDTGEGAAMQCDAAHVSLQAKTKDELSEATRDALLMREFLDANPSQLTFHGLASLLEDVPDRSLSVFFRNNHFNALLRYDNALFILVTDQGYLYEPDVVWEYLCDVGGDTQLVGWNLKPFRPHTGNATESVETTNLVNQAAGNNKEFEVQDHAYSDFALAMQLQQEEQERARLADERESHRTVAANRARERQEERANLNQMIADRHDPSLSIRRVEGEHRESEETQQHRDKFWRRRRSSSSEAEGEGGRKQDSSCDIM